jgi:hypothetical protein
MLIEKAIENYLKGYTGLTNLIGNRIYPDNLPETNTIYPTIIYSLVSGVNSETLGEDCDTTVERWQFTITTNNPTSRGDVAKQLKKAFKDYNKAGTGILGGTGGVSVSAINHEGQRDFYEPRTGIYQRMIDFMFIYDDN